MEEAGERIHNVLRKRRVPREDEGCDIRDSKKYKAQPGYTIERAMRFHEVTPLIRQWSQNRSSRPAKKPHTFSSRKMRSVGQLKTRANSSPSSRLGT